MRDLREDEVTFELSAEEPDLPIRGHVEDSGDAVQDKASEDEVLTRVLRGETWAWCTAKVTARWKNYSAEAFLGGVSCKDEQEFLADEYYVCLKMDALTALNQKLREHAAALEELKSDTK